LSKKRNPSIGDRMENLHHVVDIAKAATDLSDEYSVGLLNGLLLAEAVMLDKTPNYQRVKK
jgi:hypothetical protein